MNNIPLLIDLITDWGVEKGILTITDKFKLKGNVVAQLKKASEEVIESVDAWGNFCAAVDEGQAYEELKLELGDLGVTWILSCRAAGVDPEDCLKAAYEKIKNRTGKIKDGQFVKDK